MVAQSHEVVENLLRRILAEGVDTDRVAKRAPSQRLCDPARVARAARQRAGARLRQQHRRRVRARRHRVGLRQREQGTPRRTRPPRHRRSRAVLPRQHDRRLGECPRTCSCSATPSNCRRSARGCTPSRSTTSALGWLSDGHDVLPDELGYFLAQSWRMHPALCEAVSALAYESRLTSREPETTQRNLPGIAPGMHPIAGRARRQLDRERRRSRACTRTRAAACRARRGPIPRSPGSTARCAPPTSSSSHRTTRRSSKLRQLLDDAGFAETPSAPSTSSRGRKRPSRSCPSPRHPQRRATRNRLPAAAQPHQRRHLARQMGRIPRALPRAARLPAGNADRARRTERVHPPDLRTLIAGEVSTGSTTEKPVIEPVDRFPSLAGSVGAGVAQRPVLASSGGAGVAGSLAIPIAPARAAAIALAPPRPPTHPGVCPIPGFHPRS